MIITRTPFRMSFFGGGTDYPGWFKEHEGAVLATTFNKYCYITLRYLPPFFDHKSRIIYSKMEHINEIDEIDHPAVRECLRYFKINKGVEIHHDGDLPARTGLGSSSAFTVGLIHSLHALQGVMPTKEQLAKEAIHVEQDMIKENVGCQDQMLAAYGGFKFIEFGGNNHFQVKQMTLPEKRLENLQSHLMLYFTGFSRTASEIAKHQVENIPKKQKELQDMYQLCLEAKEVLNGDDIVKFGHLMHESWMIKKHLSDKISTEKIDAVYDAAKKAGAIGGKLLGAGGGGFLLLFVAPEKQAQVREKLKDFLLVPFKFESLGSQVVFYQPNGHNFE